MRELVPGLAVPLNEASRKALRPLVAATKANAPVDHGTLRRSIVIKRAKSPKIRPVHLVGPRSDFQSDGDRPVKYAHIVEWGRRPRRSPRDIEFGRPANADGSGGMPGTRFMTRAFEATAATVLRTLELEIPEAIRRRVAKIRAKTR